MWGDQRNIGCDATSNVEAAYSSKFIYLWKAEMKQSFEKFYIWGYIYIYIYIYIYMDFKRCRLHKI